MIVAGVLALVAFWFAAQQDVRGGRDRRQRTGDLRLRLVGIVITGPITFITEYYTGTQSSPVQRSPRPRMTGHATNMIAGLAVSMQAPRCPRSSSCIGILV